MVTTSFSEMDDRNAPLAPMISYAWIIDAMKAPERRSRSIQRCLTFLPCSIRIFYDRNEREPNTTHNPRRVSSTTNVIALFGALSTRVQRDLFLLDAVMVSKPGGPRLADQRSRRGRSAPYKGYGSPWSTYPSTNRSATSASPSMGMRGRREKGKGQRTKRLKE